MFCEPGPESAFCNRAGTGKQEILYLQDLLRNHPVITHGLARARVTSNNLSDPMDSPITDIERARTLLTAGDIGAAEVLARKILALDSRSSEAYLLIGRCRQSANDLAGASAAFETAVLLDPHSFAAWSNLGTVARATGNLERALRCSDHALELEPRNARALCNRGNLLHDLQRSDEALKCFRDALEADPAMGEAWNNSGNLELERGDLAAAEAAFESARSLLPDACLPMLNLARVLMISVRQAEGVALLKEAESRWPDNADVLSSKLFGLHFLPGVTPDELWRAHEEFGSRFFSATPADKAPAAPSHGSGDPLRVGYLSADFRQHAVAYFIRPILRHHNPARVQAVCFSVSRMKDEITAECRALAAEWHDVSHLQDSALAGLIRSQKIDILVDLSGHSSGNRLGVFSHSPAPITVTYLGYPDTTGHPNVAYRITDTESDPPGAEARHTEKLAYLESGFLCYEPPQDAPDIQPPRDAGAPVRFGCANQIARINSEFLAAVAEIMAEIPESEFHLKLSVRTDSALIGRISSIFLAHGIAESRIHFTGRVPTHREQLEWYHSIDIALDPFPCNGTTTTCEALWMGVPVISLRGTYHAARVGHSILTHMGLAELSAETREVYKQIACNLALNHGQRLELRDGMRDRLRRTVGDGPAFTRSLEDLYESWCDT